MITAGLLFDTPSVGGWDFFNGMLPDNLNREDKKSLWLFFFLFFWGSIALSSEWNNINFILFCYSVIAVKCSAPYRLITSIIISENGPFPSINSFIKFHQDSVKCQQEFIKFRDFRFHSLIKTKWCWFCWQYIKYRQNFKTSLMEMYRTQCAWHEV